MAELSKKSAEVSLKVVQGKVERARVKAEILDLIFSQASSVLFGGTALTTQTDRVTWALKLQMLIVQAEDPELDEKFTEMGNHPGDKKAALEFFVYLVSDIYKNLK